MSVYFEIYLLVTMYMLHAYLRNVTLSTYFEIHNHVRVCMHIYEI